MLRVRDLRKRVARKLLVRGAMRTGAIGVVLLSSLGGCVWVLDTESTSAGESWDCLVPLPPLTTVSPPVDAGRLWLFESATLADGTELRGAAAEITGDPCDGIDLVRDESGTARSLLVLTSAENAANVWRTDSRRLALAPRASFEDAGATIVYYDHLLFGPGFFDVETIGTGICRLEGVSECERVAGGAPLWSEDDLPVRSAFVEAGFAWLVVCRKAAAFVEHCTLGRVGLAEVETPSAYRWLNVYSGWTEDPTNATVVFDHIGPVSVGWNPYHERFSAVTMDVFQSRAAVRLATSPTEPFSRPFPLFDAIPPDDWFIGGGVEHPALRAENGRTLRISYTTNNVEDPGLHLTTFRFHERLDP